MINLPDSIITTIDEIADTEGNLDHMREIGAEASAQDLPLGALLEQLRATPHTPRIAAALAEGYLRHREGRYEAHTATIRSELDRRRAELTALQRVSAEATSSLDEDKLLRKVVDAVADVMGVEVCSIYLLQGPNVLVLRATHGLSQSAVGLARLAVGEGLTGWAAQQGRTVSVPDLWSDARAKYLPETAEDPYHSMLSVPLTATGGEQLLGVLNVQTRERREFTPDEIAFLEMITSQLRLAIENARSYGQTDAQLRQKVNALTTLHQIVVAVTSSLDLQRVLSTIASRALSLSQSQSSIIFARNRNQQQLHVEAECWEGPLQHRDLAEELALAAIQKGTLQVTMLPEVGDEAVQALLCLPLRGHGSTYGALAVFGRPGQQFDPELTDLLTDFACEAAMAIENAQLHRATQQSLEAKSVLLSELHHRVKNNLQTVSALLSLALRHTKSEEAADTLRESNNRVRSIAAAHDLLSKQAVGVTTIGEVARKVIELLEPTVQGRGSIKFLCEGPAIELETREATTLAILLNELLTNALRHGLKGREAGTVRVLYGRQGSQVWVTVADDGKGLPSDFTLSKNKGLGLSIVRTLVEADLHGQVNWGGQQGARFTLLFSPPPRGDGTRAAQG